MRRDGSLGLGATKSETIRRYYQQLYRVLQALAVSLAVGETMIVVLAAGNSPLYKSI